MGILDCLSRKPIFSGNFPFGKTKLVFPFTFKPKFSDGFGKWLALTNISTLPYSSTLLILNPHVWDSSLVGGRVVISSLHHPCSPVIVLFLVVLLLLNRPCLVYPKEATLSSDKLLVQDASDFLEETVIIKMVRESLKY